MKVLTAIVLSVIGVFCLPQAAHPAPRTWTDETGVFSVEAELVGVRGAYVQLKKTDGRVVRVPMARLSLADREYVRSQRAGDSGTASGAEKPQRTSDAAVRAAMGQVVAFEFANATLRDVLAYLGDELPVGVVADRRTLKKTGISMTAALSGRNESAQLGTALDRLLQPAGLSWTARHEVLWITTREAVESETEPRVYKLRKRLEYDRLVRDLTQNIAPQSWADVGGPASVGPVPPAALIVAQSRPAHEKIRQHYADLLEPIAAPPAAFPASFARRAPVERIGRPTTAEFIDTPLADVADYFAELHDVTIDLDRTALESVGIAHDAPVTAKVKNVSLGAALGIVTSQLGLAWTVDGDRVLVTTPEGAQKRLILIAYPVRGLAAGRNPLLTLAHALRRTVAPATWDPVGGPATIRPGIRGTLDVRQTFAVQSRLAALFEALLRAQGR